MTTESERDMTEYEQGRVYLATVKGVPNVIVIPRPKGTGGVDGWVSTKRINSAIIFHGDAVTDIRPLLVLDPEKSPVGEIRNLNAAGVRKYAESVGAAHAFAASGLLSHIADLIEAQTKPPRIPEPGLWGVVEAKRGSERGASKYLRRYDKNNGGYDWTPIDFSNPARGESFRWSDLIDPTLVREGVDA